MFSVGLSVWQLHHDMVAVATAIDLHCYQGSFTVTLRSEMTKRLSACCFWNDKEIAMFTGRPPALSHSYFSCPLLLDLSENALFEVGGKLEREVEALDEFGWSAGEETYDSTICRVMMTSALLQDEVMELFVGNSSQFSMERVK